MINKIMFTRNVFLRAAVSALALGGTMLTGMSALAVTVDVPDGMNLKTLTPVSGDIWNLQGSDFLSDGTNTSYSKTLPAALTINGIAGGSSITMNDAAGHYGNFSGSNMTLNLKDVTFIGGGGTQYGGIINSSGVVTLNSSGPLGLAMNSNNATSKGGAIYAESAVIINGKLTANANKAMQFGGAIFIQSGTAAFNGDVLFSGNSALGRGGALSMVGSASFAGNAFFDGNQIGGAGSQAVNLQGGAVYIQSNASVAPLLNFSNPDAKIIITNNQVLDASGNAAGSGGGIYAAIGGTIPAGYYTAVFAGDAYVAKNRAASGGGLFIGGNVHFTSTNLAFTPTFENNQATGGNGGGGVFANVAVFEGNATFRNNKAGISVAIGGSSGGAMAANGSIPYYYSGNQIGSGIIFTNPNGLVTVADNLATSYGGGFTSNTSMSFAGSTIFQNNQALGGAGGAAVVWNSNQIIDLNNPNATHVITGNSATGQGGAFAVAGANSTISIAGITTLNNNTSNSSGGGFYANGKIILTGSSANITANGNIARVNGGAIYASNSATFDANVSMNANTAGTATVSGVGGAIATISGAVSFTAVNGTVIFTNNSASNSGGAIYGGSATAPVIFAGSATLSNNVAGANGGAVRAFSDILFNNSAKQVTLDGNQAAGTGGALYAASSAGALVSISMSGSATITNNTATSGAGGALYATGNVTIDAAAGDTLVRGNKAGTFGGAVYSAGNFTMTASNGSALFADNMAVGGKGGAIWVGGNLALKATGGNIIFSGNTHGDPVANAIWFDNTGSTKTATFGAEAGRSITFYDPIQNNAANGVMAVEKTGSGIVSFDGSKVGADADRWSKMFANTNISEGTFEVANEAVYGALAADSATPMAVTSFTSAEGTMLQGGRVGSIRADNVTLNGDISIAGRQQDTRGVLTIAANNLTLGGGTVYFNTRLDDASSRDTDLLVLDLHGSATTGQSFINVANSGGSGAVTIGDGIKLVETNGSGTTSGAFMLGNRVAAGGFDYFLYQGGNGATGGDTNDQNWYLRSIDTNPLPAPVAPVAPTVRPEVVVSSAIQPLAIEYGYAMLSTLHERVGESYASTKPVMEERVVYCKDASQNFRCVVRVPVNATNVGRDETRWASSGWARLMGDRGLNKSDSFQKRGPNYDYTFGGIQAGLDLFANEQADGTLDKAGIYVGYGQISSDVSGPFGLNGVKVIGKAGSVDMDAYTVGAYWTHHSPSGWYSDAVIQGTWYSADAHSLLNQNVKPDGFGILASLEGGYSFKLNNGWTIEPQAQVIYQNVSFGNARDAYGQFSFDDGDSLRGRLGVRVTKSWNMADAGQEARLITGWLRANAWHEFMGKSTTSVGSLSGGDVLSFNSSLGGTWGEIGAGVTAQVSDNISLFATGAYNRSLDNKGRQGWDGRLGINVKW